jgi:thiol-disulfide isomerase/thioredoxin
MRVITLILLAMAFLPGAKVTSVNLSQLQNASQKADDTLYVVNFWATWCKPCVAEMPYFRSADEKFKSQKVKVLFVTLNSPKELSMVNKFVSDNHVKQDVTLLDAGNPNNWIDKIDSSWSGAIPATAMYKEGKKVFFREGEFTQQELDSIIKNKNQ